MVCTCPSKWSWATTNGWVMLSQTKPSNIRSTTGKPALDSWVSLRCLAGLVTEVWKGVQNISRVARTRLMWDNQAPMDWIATKQIHYPPTLPILSGNTADKHGWIFCRAIRKRVMVACCEERLGLGLALATSFLPGFKRITPMANTAQDANQDPKKGYGW